VVTVLVEEIMEEETQTTAIPARARCSMQPVPSVAQRAKFLLSLMAEKKSSVVNVSNKMVVDLQESPTLVVVQENLAMAPLEVLECSTKETPVVQVLEATDRCLVPPAINVVKDVKFPSDQQMANPYSAVTVSLKESLKVEIVSQAQILSQTQHPLLLKAMV
jgi:hypothetical protein